MKLRYSQRAERNAGAATSQTWKAAPTESTDDEVRRTIISKFDAAIALVRLLPDNAESE